MAPAPLHVCAMWEFEMGWWQSCLIVRWTRPALGLLMLPNAGLRPVSSIRNTYDAELIVAPSLSESVRHGVTTVLVGSCSLSMVCSEAEDASDIFTRVETVPREKVLPILSSTKPGATGRMGAVYRATAHGPERHQLSRPQ
ncbi:hypothetical protein ULF88_00720 [Halopseudomonas pachastrellae]|nr:hypothetical protein [Halopseudomonas pachastrellae]